VTRRCAVDRRGDTDQTGKPLLVPVLSGYRRVAGVLSRRKPSGSRAAMVVTEAPSEPFRMVAETLKAMLALDVTHDTWLADEAPSPRH